jgi:hypothetical protein
MKRVAEAIALDADAVYHRAVAEFLALALEGDDRDPDPKLVALAHEAGLEAVAEHIRRRAREDR